MFLFRFIFKSVLMWVATRLIGRLFPFLKHVLRVLRP